MIAKVILLAAGFFNLSLAHSFEVASIRASQFQSSDGEGSRRESIETSVDRLTMRNVTLLSCISWAFSVQDFQIVGTLGADRFDISAKTAAPATVSEMRAMVGTLLSERFKLLFHREIKERKSLALVVAKGGPKLRRSQEDAPGVLRPSKIGAMVAQHASMSEFVGTLSGPLRTPVVDETGLTGRYDFTVVLSSYFAAGNQGEQPDMTAVVTSALREQLGLNLEARKETVEMLVIDHVEKKPSEN